MERGTAADFSARVDKLFDGLSIRIPARARRRISQLLTALPDPATALVRLEQYYRNLPWDPGDADFDGKAIDAALTVFGNSRYLSEVLLKSPTLLRWVLDTDNLDGTISAAELRSELGTFAASATDQDAAMLIARFKRSQMFRVAMRDLLASAPLADTARALSHLAEASIQAAHDHVRQQLVHKFGRPLCTTDSGQILCNFCVLALGKLGGSELNYSSDIDLMYIHTGDGRTSGPVVTSNKDFVDHLAMRLTNLLSTMTPDGFSYRVDLRLRPEGNAGELVLPMSAAAMYYFDRARDWELQMLLKARPVAGDLRLGRRFLELVMPRIYQTTTDFSQIERLAETRDRIQRQRRRKGAAKWDIKLDPGGIRDIEFLAQCLQRLHGGQDRFLRNGGTMYALHRLREKGYLNLRDYGALLRAYDYLRRIEHFLQLTDNKQTHELPRDEADLRRLATQGGVKDKVDPGGALLREIERHCSAVSEIYDRVIGSQKATEPVTIPKPTTTEAGDARQREAIPVRVASTVWRGFLPQIRSASAALAGRFDQVDLKWGNRLMESLLERVVEKPRVLATLVERPDLVPSIAQIVEYSPYFSGYLARFPEDIGMIASAGGELSGVAPGVARQDSVSMHPDLAAILDAQLDADETAAQIRQFFRRAMLEIQTSSICRDEDVFESLARSSNLAEWVLRAAHTLALREEDARDGQATDPSNALRVIALGRLGMREFDLGSDADVAFVIPDTEVGRQGRWTRVANRIIEIISSYTADGQMFSIDARLRPLGRDGDLVQTERRFLSYFGDGAESWEALTYMKARTVAGDRDAGKAFLAQLQDVLWQRFALREQVGPLLVRMRRRLEREQGDAKPLKSGTGGYYDIDFILLYWRLLHAESFYEALNTPQRIEIIRETDPGYNADLDTLMDATRVFRALDHGTRVSKGTSSHALPPTEWQRQLLAGLVGRWLSEQDREKPLKDLVSDARTAVRKVFRTAFELPA